MTETPANPSEILSDAPKYPTRENMMKTVQDKMPGHISWASDRANFSGCRILTFRDGDVFGLTPEDALRFKEELSNDIDLPAADLMNAYFSTRANLLMVQAMPADVQGSIHVMITTQLDDDDLEEFQEVNRRVSLEMREWREKKAQQRMAEVEKIREQARLAEVGRIHEANCGKLKGE